MTAVEFALVAPVLFVLLCGIVELAVCFAANIVLQDATKAAARTGRTGHVDDAATRDETVRAMLNKRLGTILDDRKLVMSSKAYGNIRNMGKPEPYIDANGNGMRDDGETFTDVNGNGRWDKDSGVNGYGGSGQIVVYTATYPWSFFTPLIGRLISSDGILELSATAVIQNEPY